MNRENLQNTTQSTIWTRYVLVFLSIWLMATALSFEYKSAQLFWSDLFSGALLLLFGMRVLIANCSYAAWGACFVGIYLQMAPLLMWAPDSFSYLNDTIVGAMVVACSVLIPVLPQDRERDAGDIPPGWNYNPSSWLRRLPIISLAAIGWFAARYMAAYQLGYRDSVWDPFFEEGTLDVITSDVSRSFPISDAGLGAVCYTLEVLMGCKGSSKRWYTMPWIVVLFAILVIPLGFVSIILIMLQPILVGSWCSWCLLTALCMLIMIALTIDEMAAVWQYLRQVKKEGKSVWDYFWKGGLLSVELKKEKPVFGFLEAMRGVNVPWNLLLTAFLGVAVMFAEEWLGVEGRGSDSNHVLGALFVTISVIAMAEVVRGLRYVNIGLGIYFMISPAFLGGFSTWGIWSNILVGILLILLSIPQGKIRDRYGY